MQFIDAEFRKIISDLILNDSETRSDLNQYDLIDLLMRAKHKSKFSGDSNEDIWTDDEIIAQAFAIFFGGFDTSMWLLVAFSYQLARDKRVQKKLYEEINETFESVKNEEISYEDISQMKYLDSIFNEILRLHAPTLIVDRVCTKDYLLTDNNKLNIQFKKGDLLWIPVYCFHHDSKYFNHPERFDPDRFNDENKKNINSAHFIPFSMGPRGCIGKRLAEMEIKTMIIYLIKSYIINVSDKMQIPFKIKSSRFGLTPRNGAHLLLEKR